MMVGSAGEVVVDSVGEVEVGSVDEMMVGSAGEVVVGSGDVVDSAHAAGGAALLAGAGVGLPATIDMWPRVPHAFSRRRTGIH